MHLHGCKYVTVRSSARNRSRSRFAVRRFTQLALNQGEDEREKSRWFSHLPSRPGSEVSDGSRAASMRHYGGANVSRDRDETADVNCPRQHSVSAVCSRLRYGIAARLGDEPFYYTSPRSRFTVFARRLDLSSRNALKRVKYI